MYHFSYIRHFNREDKHEMTTTLHTSYANSYLNSPRGIDLNPEIDMLNSMNTQIPFGYPYNFYTQSTYYLQPQMTQRKRRAISGEEVQ